MSDQLRTPPIGGDHWTMDASKGFEARIAQVLRERGLKPATDEQMEAKEREIRQEQAERKSRILLGRLDARYRDAVPRHPQSIKWLGDYVSGNRHGYVLLGNPGGGKTWEACAIARLLLMNHSVPVTFVSAPELMEALRPNRDGASDLGQFQVAPVLVLDDLGSERSTEWTSEQMFRLADFRNVRRLPTILTSNLNGEQLKARYGDRLIDRFTEDATLLVISGKNHRKSLF